MPRRPPSVLSVCPSAPGPLQIVDEQLQENKQAPAKPRKQTCSANTPWQDLDAARRARDRAESAVVRADKVVTELGDVVAALRRQWLQEFRTNKTKADEVKQELEDAKQELEDAKQELEDAETKLEKAKKELEEAEQKYEAKASVQAGPAQAGGLVRFSRCCCVGVAPGSWPSWTVLAFRGHALLSARIPSSLSFTVLACSRVGGALGCFRFMQN